MNKSIQDIVQKGREEFYEDFAYLERTCGINLSYIKSHIDSRIIEVLSALHSEVKFMAEPYDNAKWLNGLNANKVLSLITSFIDEIKK